MIGDIVADSDGVDYWLARKMSRNEIKIRRWRKTA